MRGEGEGRRVAKHEKTGELAKKEKGKGATRKEKIENAEGQTGTNVRT